MKIEAVNCREGIADFEVVSTEEKAMAEPFEIEKEFLAGGLTKPLSPDRQLPASKCIKCGKLHFPARRGVEKLKKGS